MFWSGGLFGREVGATQMKVEMTESDGGRSLGGQAGHLSVAQGAKLGEEHQAGCGEEE